MSIFQMRFLNVGLIGKRITKIFSIIIAMPNRVYKLIIVQTKDVSNKV